MKTANEIQLEALADAYDELCCEFEGVRTQVENIIHLVESGRDPKEIANYAKHFLDDIVGMIEDRDA